MPVATRKSDLLDPEFMSRLEQLDIVSRKIFAGKMKGERRSKRKGQSVEFADYRNYVVGDDLRFLDWNIYGRLERLFIKLFFEEEDLHVNVLVDMSKSMDFGNPSKSLYARRVAAAIAYIGLVNYNRVSLVAFSDQYGPEMVGVRGRRLIHQVLGHLSDLQADGAGNLSAACRQFAIRHPQRGVVLVLSDFMDKGGYETGLRYLIGRHYDLYVIQMLSPEEIEPNLNGDLRLRDVEDGDFAEVTISRALINRYKQNLNAYCSQLRDFCTRRGVTYMFTSTAVPFDQLVLNYLRRRGLLR
ncbi:MAG TPA: DUF58 domain-containing protein [Phycisphaerae bacterium]|jgi:uncharacterized protein (DUF58 family)|nr:DUF58 domain-containing protein [Phycisphaerae bacterium]HOB74172.1 DUF58 domain-containing protein [Phycisphaerae bacterium]HOJ55904.1 DUF58 domain-containing protein [Phycisphaerae bacterium]HOL27630.1 DUF58 domain-containing protein [Phycisphaerae bacterium]HPP22168.1 DUF58 domain-containing protein [Phycisphaerae bacterium]